MIKKCDTPCYEIHNNTKRCYRNYLAIECIDKMFYGNYCNDSCANCPGDPGFCDINGICYNLNEACDNDSYTGEKCDTPCSMIYNNTKRCDRNYIAIECIDQMFYGNYCNDSCANCPGDPGFCDIYGNCLNSTEICDNDW